MSALTKLAQGQALDNLITLFQLDATPVGGGWLAFTCSTGDQTTIRWAGNEYVPVPVEAEGFESTSTGALPTPTLRISNVTNVIRSLVISGGDLVGCRVRRIRTFARFLDDGPEPDPTAHLPIDEYRIERKTAMTRVFIEFSLCAAIDQEGQQIPGRIALRDTCDHRYRRHLSGSSFNYSQATCPYVGAASFDINDQSVPAASDRCSKKLSGCVARFGRQPLPFRGFPGLARVRG